MLTCSTRIEQTVSQRLRDEFGSTLPRFDMLSALDRAGEAGLTMGEAAGMLMVSNGNVTGLAARLKTDGLIEAMAGDRPAGSTRAPDALGPDPFHRHGPRPRTLDRGPVRRPDGTVEADDLTHLLERAKRSLHVTTHEELNG